MRRILVASLLLAGLILSSPGNAQQENTDYIVEAFVSNPQPYAGEQIIYGFRYYTYVTPVGLIDQLPDFEGFWLTDVYELEGGRIETIGNRQYVVNEVYAEISPITPGEITISPSVLEIPETVFTTGQNLRTDAITLQVQPLPAGAPPEFNGAVGQFNALIDVDRSRITLGEPVLLTMTLDGTGNLEQLPAPDLPDVPGWRIFANPPRYVTSAIGGLRFGQKVFEWLLVPEEVGSQQFPAITFAYFAPQDAVYRTITFEPFTVEVFPGADNARALPTALPALERGRALEIKPVPASLQGTSGEPNAIFWIAWVIMPLLTVSAAAWLAFQRYEHARRRQVRQSRALARALQRIRASRQLPPRQANQQMTRAMEMYLADKIGAPVIDLEAVLVRHGIAEDTRTDFKQRYAQVEGGQFMPENDTQDTAAVIARIVEILTTVDKQWS
ncbi:MAG: BatD family protein [Anaerolineae bacterium]